MPAFCSATVVAGEVPEQDIAIVVGDDTTIVFEFRYATTGRLYDWTGWTFASKVKTAIGGTVEATGTVTHGGTDGRITVVYPTADTSLLTPDDSGVYDIEGVDSGGKKHTVVGGVAFYRGSVT